MKAPLKPGHVALASQKRSAKVQPAAELPPSEAIPVDTPATESSGGGRSTAEAQRSVLAHAETVPKKPLELSAATRRRPVRTIVIVALLLTPIGLLAAWASRSGISSRDDGSLALYTVSARDLPINVKERGTLESQENVQVICEVDDVPGDAIQGTQIIGIVENGTWVEKGDLIVELDTASHTDRIDEQVLDTNQAQADYLARKIDYENRLTINKTMTANAELEVELAKLRVRQFEDEQGGTFQIDLQEIESGIQEAEARMLIDDRNEIGVVHLHGLGYKSKGDLAQAHLQALRARSTLRREEAKRRELVEYTYIRSKLQMAGALRTAERALIQVERDNTAALAQQKAWLKMSEMGKETQETRLARYREQLEKCKIYAPQGGMVAYHSGGNSSLIEEGVAVRYNQPILSVPNLKRMQVKTSVHESMVDSVRPGMSASVHIDAFPDRHYEATVDSVGVLPSTGGGGWFGSDAKVYATVITIDEDVDQLKPGMTASVEIHIEYLTDVLCVPAPAIVQRGEETWCYVSENGKTVKRPIETGETNDKFVQICAGLEEGDRVVLDPSSILPFSEAHQPVSADDEAKKGNSADDKRMDG